jgi:ATP-dependent Zn protease
MTKRKRTKEDKQWLTKHHTKNNEDKQWSTKHYTKNNEDKQWSTKHYTKNNEDKQWSTKHYTKNNEDKQWSTKHYTKNSTMSNRNRSKHREWSHVPRKGKQFLLHPYILYCCLFCIVCIRFFLNMASLLRNKIHSPQRCRIKETNKVYETHKVIQNQRWL